MASIAEKRKKIETLVYQFMKAIDPSGNNYETYKEMFSKMSDDQFSDWMNELDTNPKKHFYLEMVEYVNDLKYENIEKAAKLLGVPLYESVYLPHVNGDPDKNIVVTPEKVPVGYLHEKRMMQTLEKKNSGSTHRSERNPITGTVTGDDKNARNSDVETYAMLSINADAALKEFMGPRADDEVASKEMYTMIDRDGYVNEDDLTNDPRNRTSLNTLAVYFIMQGFKTNLLRGDNLLPEPREDIIKPKK